MYSNKSLKPLINYVEERLEERIERFSFVITQEEETASDFIDSILDDMDRLDRLQQYSKRHSRKLSPGHWI